MPLVAVLLLAPVTLSAFLKTHPPEGAWFALDAENVRAEKGTDLADFDRKAIKVGEITAIVPRTMVVFSDPSKETPNLAEGLARDDKVLALLATLDDGQWRTLSGQGLGLNDLRDDQRPIFASILPKPFVWRASHRDEVKTVSEKDAEAARLRMNRRVVFAVGNARNPRSMGMLMDAGMGGETPYSGSIVEDKDSQFGVRIRRKEPNVAKKSLLPLLSASVTVREGATVGSLLAAVSQATRQEILADRRVAVLKVAASPGSYRAGDLAQALALATTGTYRKVGSAYALVADLEGALPRWERLSAWHSGLRQQASRQRMEWQAKVTAGGGIRRIGYDAKNPIVPPSDFADEMQPVGSPLREGSTPLPPNLQKEIDRIRKESPMLDIDPSRVEAMYEVAATLALPGGEVVTLGAVRTQAPEIRPVPERFQRNPVAAPRIGVPEGMPLSVVAEDRASLESALRLADEFGFGELWLETNGAEALRFAIENANRPVRLVVRPWTISKSAKPADPDRTGTGLPAGQIENATPAQRDLISPFDPTTRARRTALEGLAKTVGLKGIVVLDLAPPGYDVDPTVRRTQSGIVEFGYSESARLTFLRKEGLDPIDVSDQWIGSVQSLYRPFFAYGRDLDTRSSSETELIWKDRQAWAAFRRDANGREMQALLDSFGTVPILVQVPIPYLSVVMTGHSLRPYASGSLPSANDPRSPDEMRVVRLTKDSTPIRPRSRLAIDLSDVPPSQWSGLLRRLFVPKGNP